MRFIGIQSFGFATFFHIVYLNHSDAIAAFLSNRVRDMLNYYIIFASVHLNIEKVYGFSSRL